jgi:hypothetical protein
MRQWEEWADMATVVAFGGYCLRSTGTWHSSYHWSNHGTFNGCFW